jgi:poly-gamma-glutamate capsule biosynthesis protein CapA/YwtB (metallophosphatase superfamily)
MNDPREVKRSRGFAFALLLCSLASQDSFAKDSLVDLTIVGDVMVAEEPGALIEAGNDPFAGVAKYLDKKRLRIANLECVIATGGTAEIKPFTFRAHPRTIPTIHNYFDAVSVANNHSGDFGKQAFVEQLGLLEAADLPWFGGGRDLSRAHAPWVAMRNGLRIAFLGYVEFKPRSFEASTTNAGVAWSGEDEHVLRDIRDARARYHADLVIPFMHWGWEDEGYPSERQRVFARRMIDAGADMVVGSHPHVTQGAEIYHGKPIVYSLGNFLFNGFETEPTTTGWILEARLGKTGVRQWRTRVVNLAANGVPRLDQAAASPCGDSHSDEVRQCTGK